MPALEQNALYTRDEVQLEPSGRHYSTPLDSDTVGVARNYDGCVVKGTPSLIYLSHLHASYLTPRFPQVPERHGFGVSKPLSARRGSHSRTEQEPVACHSEFYAASTRFRKDLYGRQCSRPHPTIVVRFDVQFIFLSG